MEQYIHMLIPAISAGVPQPEQVVAFFDELSKTNNFHPGHEGLRIQKPSGRSREARNPLTGEVMMFPLRDNVKIATPAEIPSLTKGLTEFSVLASGQWQLGDDPPIVLYKTDGTPYRDNYLCQVGYEVRPGLVSMSTANGNSAVLEFGEPCEARENIGYFLNPWTNESVGIPDAGCARFWIEFEFGRFIYPMIGNNFDVLNPSLIAMAEECFQTEFAQGCRYW